MSSRKVAENIFLTEIKNCSFELNKMENAFIRYVYRRFCKFEEHSEKVNEIENAVKSTLNKMLQEIGTLYPNIAISKIIDGGSFYEQTKVGSPDEFDFMTVINQLSLPKAIQLEDGCFPWFKKIYLSEKNEKFQELLDYGYLRNETITDRFWSKLLILCRNEEFSEKKKYGTLRTIGCKNRKLFLKHTASKDYEDQTKSEDQSQTNCRALVHIPTLDIGVDLMLAIEYPNVEEIIAMNGFPPDFKDLVLKNGCHLVAKQCQSSSPCSKCWHVSLASSESQLMREMNEKHKHSYQVLKYLLTREVPHSGKCANLSSYTLKNAFLFHVYGGGGCKNDIVRCIHDILDYLQNNFRKGRMPCFLSRNINTWGSVYKFPVFRNVTDGTKKGLQDDSSLEIKWYAVCWLELWRRLVKKASILLKDVIRADDSKVLNTFYMLKESMMKLIECYCKCIHIMQYPSGESYLMTDISDAELNTKFKRYFGELEKLFDLKLGSLLELDC